MNLVKSIFYSALITLTSFNAINPVLAQDQPLNTIKVTGQGLKSIPTTIIKVNLGVEVIGKDAITVQEEIAQKTNSLVNFLKQKQVNQLQTTGFRLQPQYQYQNNQRIFQGYQGINTVSFQLPVEQIGNLLDESVQAGATRIDNISFTATLEEINTAQQEALIKATEDAQEQAQTVLQALNLNSQNITRIEINRTNFPQPRLAQFSEATNGTPIISGEQNVSASVTLYISY